jgi:TatD DNase family protein
VVDTHCHLEVCEPPDAELVARARGAGVDRIATVGMNEDSIGHALEAAEQHEEVFAIVGCHPHETTGFGDRDLEPIARAADHPRARAIGETGLDYYYRDRAPREHQLRAFEAQLGLAAEKDLPVVIHTRDAEDDTFAALREHAAELTVVLHCFSAPARLDECVEHGYVCSFAGNVTYPKATDLQRAARKLPDELLLVETDSPYLAPQPVRGKPNEPANVTHTARFLAELRGADYDELERIVEANAERVFGP